MMLDKKEIEFLKKFAQFPDAERDTFTAMFILGTKTRQTGDAWLKVLQRAGALSCGRSEAHRKNIWSLTPEAIQELADYATPEVHNGDAREARQ